MVVYKPPTASTRAQTVFQDAMHGTPKKMLQVAKTNNDLTERQKHALVTAARSETTTAHAPTQSVQRPVETTFQRLLAFRDNPAYNWAWVAHGRPLDWPAPRPFFSGQASSERYVVTHASSVPTSFSVPAGQLALIWLNPKTQQPVRFDCSAAGTFPNASGFSYNHTYAQTDQSLVGSTTTPVSWGYENPHSLVGDSNAYLTNFAKVDPTKPPDSEIQLLGGELEVEAAVPYTSQCVVYPFSTGDAPEFTGMSQPKYRWPYSQSQVVTSGLRSELIGHVVGFRGTATSGNTSPTAFGAKYARPVIMMGGSPTAHRTFHVISAPDDAWARCGYLDSTQAADNGIVSSTYNLEPRNNPVYQSKYGFVVVDNTAGGSAVTLIARYSCSFAQIVRPADGSSLGITALAAALHSGADALTPHHPPDNVGAFGLRSTHAADVTAVNTERRRVISENPIPSIPSRPREMNHPTTIQHGSQSFGSRVEASVSRLASKAGTKLLSWGETALKSVGKKLLGAAEAAIF